MDPFFLSETENFFRSHGHAKAMGPSQRPAAAGMASQGGPSFWEQLSMDMKKGGEQVTFFRQAIVKLALSTSLVTATSPLERNRFPRASKLNPETVSPPNPEPLNPNPKP